MATQQAPTPFIRPNPNDVADARRADALAEIRQMSNDVRTLTEKAEQDRRTMQQQADKIEMLERMLTETRHAERVVTRKLIRLASSQRNISLLAREAEVIMADAKDWLDETETEEQAKAETESARAAVANLPART